MGMCSIDKNTIGNGEGLLRFLNLETVYVVRGGQYIDYLVISQYVFGTD